MIRMFVAKAIGLGYQFVMNEKKEEDVYFGQADMQSEKFVKKAVDKLQMNKNITASSFTHLNSPQHKYPHQTDGYSCGVLVLWYHLFDIKEKGFIKDGSTTTIGNSDINLRSI